MELKKYKLGDVVDKFISGDWGDEQISTEAPNEVYCIRGADITPIANSDFDNIPKRYVSDRTLAVKLLKEGNLIIEKSGGSPTQSTGRIAYISKDLVEKKQKIVCSNFCTAIQIKPNWNPLYVYYYWLYMYNSDVFFNFEGKTSGIKNLQIDNALSAIEIEYIPIEKQNKIVSILSSIDQKITLNRQINQNLEAMAKQLYDYWFVQFDFPNEEGKPYKSSGGKMVYNPKLKRKIPEGWEYIYAGDFIPIVTGKEDANYSCSDGEYPFFTCSKDVLRCNTPSFDGKAILIAGNGGVKETKTYNENQELSNYVLVLQRLDKSIKAAIKKGDVIIEETELKGIDEKEFDL